MQSIGSDIVSGIWSGISSGWGWLKDSVSNLAGSLFESAKNALGINSPSKVFADEVGKWIPAGIAVGIDKNAKTAINSVKNLAIDTLGGAKAGLSNSTATVSGAGGVVNNFTQVINSPRELSRLEIYRQSKNLLGYAGGGV
jgi:phage-related protein